MALSLLEWNSSPVPAKFCSEKDKSNRLLYLDILKDAYWTIVLISVKDELIFNHNGQNQIDCGIKQVRHRLSKEPNKFEWNFIVAIILNFGWSKNLFNSTKTR